MRDAERLKVAQEQLGEHEHCREYATCWSCDSGVLLDSREHIYTREERDAAHKPGCRWMIAMGKRDA